MGKDYISKVGDAFRVTGSRVSLDSLVYLFLEGVSAEGMVESYPTLTLEQVHGALAYYLANRAPVDAYLAEGEQVAEILHRRSERTDSELIAKLRRHSPTPAEKRG